MNQYLAIMLATANYFCNFLADIYLFTPKMRKADIIDSGRVRWCYFYRQHCTQHTTRRYLSHSEADFGFSPRRGDVEPTGVKFGTEEGKGPLLRAKFHHHWCNDEGIGPQNWNFLLRFDQNVEYKRPAGAYALRDFHKICRVCSLFQDALAVKISSHLLKRLWSYGGF